MVWWAMHCSLGGEAQGLRRQQGGSGCRHAFVTPCLLGGGWDEGRQARGINLWLSSSV